MRGLVSGAADTICCVARRRDRTCDLARSGHELTDEAGAVYQSLDVPVLGLDVERQEDPRHATVGAGDGVAERRLERGEGEGDGDGETDRRADCSRALSNA